MAIFTGSSLYFTLQPDMHEGERNRSAYQTLSIYCMVIFDSLAAFVITNCGKKPRELLGIDKLAQDMRLVIMALFVGLYSRFKEWYVLYLIYPLAAFMSAAALMYLQTDPCQKSVGIVTTVFFYTIFTFHH
jgi:hypothetical protein